MKEPEGITGGNRNRRELPEGIRTGGNYRGGFELETKQSHARLPFATPTAQRVGYGKGRWARPPSPLSNSLCVPVTWDRIMRKMTAKLQL